MKRYFGRMRRWLGALRNRTGLSSEMEEEFRTHIELRAEDLMRTGVPASRAVRQARLEFGSVERYREEGRAARGLARIEELFGDVWYALRALRREPGFAAVALLTVALGIGANTAVFSVVNGVLLRPLPYPEAESLALLHQSNPRTGEMMGRISAQDLEDWQARTRVLESIAGYASVPTILTGQGDALEIEMSYVWPEFFEVLGARIALGRPLDGEDDRSRRRSAVVSNGLWRTTLGGDPDVIGSTILLRGVPFTVVGVAASGVSHPTPGTSVWVPHSLVEPNMFANGMPARGDRYLWAIGRIAPNADASQAQRELSALSAELAATWPESNEDWTMASVVPLRTSIVGDVDEALFIILGVVGFILLIVCANLANLLLARGSARRREVAVRAALGAGRRRIIRQLLTESAVLGTLGGALGLAMSYWGVRTILALSADTLPRVENVHIDPTVLAFGLLLSVTTGLLFGMAPALRLARDPQSDLRGGRGTVGAEGRRLRSLLVVGEVALAVLLVIGAGLMARSFLALRDVDPGFEPEHVLTVAMQLNYAGVPREEIGGFLVSRRQEILNRVRALPGVESAGMINVFPLRRDDAFSTEYRAAGADAAPGNPMLHADTRYVDPGYLRTMRIPLLSGSHFDELWPAGSPVPVIMSERAARLLWPTDDAVGKRIEVPWGESIVVGVVGNVRQVDLGAVPAPAVYFPQRIAPRLLATMVVRTSGDPATLIEPVRNVIREVDPDQPVRSMAPLEDVVSESIAQDRFFTVLFAVFGGLALMLAAVGVYGVLAYTVRQRTQEIGVRIALGARTFDVLGMVSGAGMRLVGFGLLIGTIAALALGRLLAHQLYDISPTDPLAFLLAPGFLAAVALLATCVPALRAARVPPMTALRPD